MTRPVVPPGGEELREDIAQALAEDINDRGDQWSIWTMTDALLPTVLAYAEEQGRRRAAEEIERLADSLTDRVRTWVLNLLRDRAAALAPENARPE